MKRTMNVLILSTGAATAIAVTTIAGVSQAASSHTSTYRAAIATVNPGASAANKAGYQQATGVKMTRPVQAKAPSDLALLGGGECTVGYGAAKSQCLPITPPDAAAMQMSVQEMPWTCVQVRRVYPAGISVNKTGGDPDHLDTNHDGVACGKGDGS